MEQQSAVLLRRLNPYCAKALEAAATLCQTRAHAEIAVEHWLLKLLELGEGDITVLARRYEWDMDALWQSLLAHLDALPRTVHTRPQLSGDLQTLMKSAWLAASLQDDNETVRSVNLLEALVAKPKLLHCEGLWPLFSLSEEHIRRLKPMLDAISEERPELQQQESLSRTPSSLSDIVDKILRDRHDMRGQDFVFTLAKEYPRREQVVQYGEDDLRFISRLLAEVGIWFRFTADPKLNIDVVEFYDDQQFYQQGLTLSAVPPSGMHDSGVESSWALSSIHQVVQKSVSTGDYNYRTATSDLSGSADITRGDPRTYGEAYHYADNYLTAGAEDRTGG